MLYRKIKVPTYNLSYIIKASNDKLIAITRELTLNNVFINRECIIEILNHLGGINNDMNYVELMNDDILIEIFEHLDAISIKFMYRVCKRLEKLTKLEKIEEILKDRMCEYFEYKAYIDDKYVAYGGGISDNESFFIMKKFDLCKSKRYVCKPRCKKLKIYELIDIIWDLECPKLSIIIIENDRLKLMNILIDILRNKTYKELLEWSLAKLNYYYQLVKTSKNDLVDTIYDKMNKMNLIRK